MSVFVTGGAGYIISHVVLELLEAGEEPIVLDDLSTGFREAVPGVVNFIRGDVGDEKLFTQVIAEHRVDAIIHLAGSLSCRIRSETHSAIISTILASRGVCLPAPSRPD